ncbi:MULTISPECIES: hypothetical protein [Microvirga]|jgi:hypothetical protein|uniref:Uncharacterized protein n=1 Tax=Microvirga mediterraneensis TaxID=2754695 RepID=A0A838BV79_9HYPH|nr:MULTISPECIES: hypothetical protein [Microvirga]MBA1159160.1 hypothetical protein [Microvirga mediterraneensis]
MTTDYIDRCCEQTAADIARLQVLNRRQADLAGALASMFDEQELPAFRTLAGIERTTRLQWQTHGRPEVSRAFQTIHGRSAAGGHRFT